ncbi:leucyl/phenylalanyl-tRNA--protein transferase [Kitasatospora xanthocidica]|uniref:leucyl/phenylalanyl-tRNA--protein transferase n=1 Tax=Kitasatospora xanthocidica TaxID=83382 RepID=UPI001E55FEC5|nr:leucyl/phenylalanyl-tRNA--protein transferase [Kitasatospora xanthocidica]
MDRAGGVSGADGVGGPGEAAAAFDALGLFDTLDLRHAPGDGPVAFGGVLGPAELLAAYRRGLFPLPAADEYASAYNEALYGDAVDAGEVALLPGGGDPYALAWWSPDPRPVIAADGVRLGHRLARRLRNRSAWWTSADRAFGRVLEACAEGRQPAWLTEELALVLTRLHALGAAHSGEVWEGEELIGGVFGVAVGPVLSLDSMFRRRPDAARVAVADLGARFGAAGGRLLDAQWDGPHVRSLGAEPVARVRYLAELAGGGGDGGEASGPALEGAPMPVARLG